MADNIPRFGASDFWLVQTDAAQLREQLRSALETVLGRPVVDSDPHMVLASAFLPFFIQGQASADAAAKATLRSFAVGQDLDRIADSTCVVGYLDRRPSQGAILACVLAVHVARPSSVAEAVSLTWSALRTLTVGGAEVTFGGHGIESIPFAAGAAEQDVFVPVYLVSDATGRRYNGLLAPLPGVVYPVIDPDILVDTLSATDSSGADCTCTDVRVARCGSTYGGSDGETDEEFALRTAWQAKALRVPGSYEYFALLLSNVRLLASSYVAPRVDSDGRIIMAWCDKAAYYASSSLSTFRPLSVRGAAYDEFFRAVQSSLLVEQRAIVYEAKLDVGGGYSVTYHLPASTVDAAQARAAVEDAWRLYVSDHAWHCGVVLSVSDIVSVLRSAGASDVQVTTSHTAYYVLPADTMTTDAAFSLTYLGLSTDSSDPVGGDGEEVVP